MPTFTPFVKREWLLLVVFLLAAGAYALVGVLRFNNFAASGYDLGIFDQAIWHYSHFQVPADTVREVPNLLGDHFHPVIALLAPTYWVWSDARMLIVDQAILVALSVFPVYLFCKSRVGRTGAYLLVLAYTLFWGIQTAIEYDFHEVAFAPLFIATCILAGDRQKWGWFYASLGMLLLVKEDMALVGVGIGIYLLLSRRFKHAVVTVVAACMTYFVTTKLMMPLLAGSPSDYWTYVGLGDSIGEAVMNTVKHPGLPAHLLLEHIEVKAPTILKLFFPFLALIIWSPLLAIAVLMVVERMLPSVWNYWGTMYHYSLTIAPIMAIGAADGLRNLLTFFRIQRSDARAALVGLAGILMVSIAVYMTKDFPLRAIAHADSYRTDAMARTATEALSYIPASSSVMAQDFLIPHLSQRDKIYEVRPSTPLTTFMAVDLLGHHDDAFPNQTPQQFFDVLRERINTGRYVTIFRSGGLIVLQVKTANGPRNGVPITAAQLFTCPITQPKLPNLQLRG